MLVLRLHAVQGTAASRRSAARGRADAGRPQAVSGSVDVGAVLERRDEIINELELAHAVPAFPTRSELWLKFLEAYEIRHGHSVHSRRTAVLST